MAIDTEAAEGDPESGLLGTDFMFFTAFLGKLNNIYLRIICTYTSITIIYIYLDNMYFYYSRIFV